jgi:DNA-binding MarR family transcriptional regulator
VVPTGPARSDTAAAAFADRMAMTFADLGFPRMAARVLFTLLVREDDQGMTAAELADSLGVSPAAISGAVRYLGQFDLVAKSAVRGSRSVRYRLPPDAWYAAAASESRRYPMLVAMAEEGVTAAGGDATTAGRRVAEMRDFFAFVATEMDGVLARWKERTRDSG